MAYFSSAIFLLMRTLRSRPAALTQARAINPAAAAPARFPGGTSAVFVDVMEYRVRDKSREIGTLQAAPEVDHSSLHERGPNCSVPAGDHPNGSAFWRTRQTIRYVGARTFKVNWQVRSIAATSILPRLLRRNTRSQLLSVSVIESNP